MKQIINNRILIKRNLHAPSASECQERGFEVICDYILYGLTWNTAAVDNKRGFTHYGPSKPTGSTLNDEWIDEIISKGQQIMKRAK